MNEAAIFWGRFHPLLVHLPIGFLLLAGLIEGLRRWPRFQPLEAVLGLLLLLSSLSAALAAWMGWSLAEAGRHGGDTLEWHRWLGLGVLGLSLLLWVMERGWLPGWRRLRTPGLLLAVGLTAATGHFGGLLTHGEGYLLQAAPEWLRPTAAPKPMAALPPAAQKDSLRVFAQLIQPALVAKCSRCHNAETAYGGLDMSSLTGMQKGGKEGPLWHAGDPMGSEILRRVSLPAHHLKHMPPSGEPLSYPEIHLLSWWIAAGADLGPGLPEEVPADIVAWLGARYGLDLRERPYYEQSGLTEVDPEALRQLREAGFRAAPLAADNGLLDVSLDHDSLAPGRLTALLKLAAPTTTWLDLSGQNPGEALTQAGAWPHLTRLNLSQNQLLADQLEALAKAPHLAVLNLTGATLPPQTPELLGRFPALQTVYVWNSSLSDSDIERLSQAKPELEVIRGFAFE